MPRPIIKWAGGKTKVFPYFLPLYEAANCTRFVDLFCGSLSLPLAIPEPTHTEAVFNDINSHLIKLYREIQSNYGGFIKEIKTLDSPSMNNREAYEQVRDNFNKSPTPSQFLYLNKRGFNGLYRENRSGEFNVPFRAYNTHIYEEKVLSEFHEWCRENVLFFNQSVFDFPFHFFKPGDLVYLDPPYYPSEESQFTSYWRTPFLVKEQEKLALFCDTLDKAGIKFILSNSPCEQVRKLYSRFHQFEFRIERQMRDAKKGESQKSSEPNEILVWNFGKIEFN